MCTLSLYAVWRFMFGTVVLLIYSLRPQTTAKRFAYCARVELFFLSLSNSPCNVRMLDVCFRFVNIMRSSSNPTREIQFSHNHFSMFGIEPDRDEIEFCITPVPPIKNNKKNFVSLYIRCTFFVGTILRNSHRHRTCLARNLRLFHFEHIVIACVLRSCRAHKTN